MTTLHATPYNLDATGFYFTDAQDYQKKAATHFDRYGNLVEEYEILFIDGDDAALFEACGINQANLNSWFDCIGFMQDYEKVSLYYLVSMAGYNLAQALEKLDETSIYQGDLKEAATELFDECYLHSIAANMSNIQFYIDYDKFARDCQYSGDMTEFEYAGVTYTCTNSSSL